MSNAAKNDVANLKKVLSPSEMKQLSKIFTQKAAANHAKASAYVREQIAPTLQRANNSYRAELVEIRDSLWPKINVTNPSEENLKLFASIQKEIAMLNARRKGGKTRRQRHRRTSKRRN